MLGFHTETTVVNVSYKHKYLLILLPKYIINNILTQIQTFVQTLAGRKLAAVNLCRYLVKTLEKKAKYVYY
ncbi:hypothetical protein bsdcttw_11920 [Anaerocolumna chitinilytica]|uniref:Uncharacterized protein n=1 Tax=Anaerocolumna chitinilytica TaxID=1727145 RepID=A0A7I8DLJ3_9FIRM|nr:hypothetical protein bsdcttw_11920 [Anaerocolumna chitinilytica]